MSDRGDFGTQDRVAAEKRFHDERYGESSGERPASRFYAVTRASVADFDARIASIPAGSRVLELGCGLNSKAWRLADRGVEVTGIDISSEAVRQSTERAAALGSDGVAFQQMNAEDLSFDDATFDVVIGDGIVHHLDTSRAMAEVSRCLVPGGRFIFSEPMGLNPLINVYRRLTPSQRTEDEHPFTKRDLELISGASAEVDLAFFHLVSLLAIPLLSVPKLTQAGFESVLASLDSVDQWLFERLPLLRAYGWMVNIDGRTVS